MSLEIIKLERNDCPGCRILGMILKHEVAYPIIIVNLDQKPEENDTYKVMAVPVLVFKKDGIEVERLVDANDFKSERINELIERYK